MWVCVCVCTWGHLAPSDFWEVHSTLSFSAVILSSLSPFFPPSSGNGKLFSIHYQLLSDGMVSILLLYGREDCNLEARRWPFHFFFQFYQTGVEIHCCREWEKKADTRVDHSSSSVWSDVSVWQFIWTATGPLLSVCHKGNLHLVNL